jgi:hypothetical protein
MAQGPRPRSWAARASPWRRGRRSWAVERLAQAVQGLALGRQAVERHAWAVRASPSMILGCQRPARGRQAVDRMAQAVRASPSILGCQRSAQGRQAVESMAQAVSGPRRRSSAVSVRPRAVRPLPSRPPWAVGASPSIMSLPRGRATPLRAKSASILGEGHQRRWRDARRRGRFTPLRLVAQWQRSNTYQNTTESLYYSRETSQFLTIQVNWQRIANSLNVFF